MTDKSTVRAVRAEVRWRPHLDRPTTLKRLRKAGYAFTLFGNKHLLILDRGTERYSLQCHRDSYSVEAIEYLEQLEPL